MGAAFLLLETRGVTTLSLLFGSTWLVNAGVFAGIVVMALVANEIVIRWHPQKMAIWFVVLFASVLVVWAAPYGALNALPLGARAILGSALHALPIGCAGVIVSTLLARTPTPSAALGSNLLGAVVGGCLEYLSMILGLRALALVALALYVLAYVVWLVRGRAAARIVGPVDATHFAQGAP
jgi:hypothetical protein